MKGLVVGGPERFPVKLDPDEWPAVTIGSDYNSLKQPNEAIMLDNIFHAEEQFQEMKLRFGCVII